MSKLRRSNNQIGSVLKIMPSLHEKTRKFSRVVLGGTFDHLHKGHKTLIAKALEIGDHVLLGLTTDKMAKKKHQVEIFDERKRALEDFLKKIYGLNRAQIVPIDDPYGSTLTMEDIEAIVVSKETAPRAEEINALRLKRGLKALEIVIVDTVLAEDMKPIYSTRIRMGEISENGRLLRPRTEPDSDVQR